MVVVVVVGWVVMTDDDNDDDNNVFLLILFLIYAPAIGVHFRTFSRSYFVRSGGIMQ